MAGVKKIKTNSARSARAAVAAPNVKNTYLYQKIMLFFLAFLVYANGIKNDYNFDDELYVKRAQEIVSKGGAGIRTCFSQRTFSDGENNYEYRPVSLLLLVWQFKLVGESPHTGHLISVLLYAATSLVLFVLLRRWFGVSRSWFAFCCCLLFILHPLHTEVVDSIKNRDELLSLLFMMVALLATNAYGQGPTTLKWGIASLGVLLAKLSKRTFIALTPIVPISLWFFSDMSLKKIIRFIFFMFIVYLGLLIALRFIHTADVVLRNYYEHENPFYKNGYHAWQRIPTGLYVMGRYLFLLLFPIQLAYYYGYSYVPVVGWSDPLVWVSLVAHAMLIYFVIMGLKKKSLFSFGGIIYLLSVFAFSNILRPAPGIMAERFVYGASIGFCIMQCALLYKALKMEQTIGFAEMRRNKQFALMLTLFCCLLGTRTLLRNADWKDKYTLYTHDMKYLQRSSKANVVHGQLYMEIGEKYRQMANRMRSAGNGPLAKEYMDSAVFYGDIAEKNFLRALEITPDLPSAASYLGLINVANDSLQDAKYYFARALHSLPYRANFNCNMGIVYFRLAQYDSARYYIQKAIKYDSSYTLAYKNLYDLLIIRQDTMAAIDVLTTAVKHIHNPLAAYVDLGTTFLWKQDTTEALKYYEAAAEMKPGSANALLFLKNYYHSRNDIERAAYYDGLLTQLMTERQAQ